MAQDSLQVGELVLIETNVDNEFYGHVLENTGEYIKVQSGVLGEVDIPYSAIKNFKLIRTDRIKENEYWADNPQSTRYFWSPNGYGLKKGEGYYQNVWVFFNQLSVGLSDNASIGVGLVPTFLLDTGATPMWITPKISLPLSQETSNAQLGVGALLGTVVGASNSSYGIVYGVLTLGSQDSKVNLGAGMGYSNKDWAAKPTLTFSAMMRTGKRGYFITENYLLDWGDNGFGIVSIGGRTVGKRLSFDYGVMVPIESGSISYGIPWIGVAVPFGN